MYCVSSNFQQFLCTEEFGRYCAFSSFSFCNQESDTVSGCQAVKFILALKNLGIWQVLCFQLFPAVSVHSGLWQALCFQL